MCHITGPIHHSPVKVSVMTRWPLALLTCHIVIFASDHSLWISAICAREREGHDRTRRQNEFCLTSPEGEGGKKKWKKEKRQKRKAKKVVSYSRSARSWPPLPLIDCQSWQTPPAEGEMREKKKDRTLESGYNTLLLNIFSIFNLFQRFFCIFMWNCFNEA